jgi:hypothetical protein
MLLTGAKYGQCDDQEQSKKILHIPDSDEKD